MIALTLFDRRTSETFSIAVEASWEPDLTIYEVVRRVVLPPGWTDPRH